MFKEIKGDLIALALAGEFDVICQGCNCWNIMGAGISVPFRKEFKADNLKLEFDMYKGDYNKLGQIDWGLYYPKIDAIIQFQKDVGINRLKFNDCIAVVNCYTQYNLGADARMYALINCLVKLNHTFKGKHIGLPLIGAGIGGLNPVDVIEAFKTYLPDCNVTVVHYDKNT